MKKILIIMSLLLPCIINLFAETIEEGRALHPEAGFYYCKEKTYDKDVIPPMSSIERIAWDKLTIYIKYYGQDREERTTFDGESKEIGNWTYLPLMSCTLAINIHDGKLAYINVSGKVVEVFDLDISKTAKSVYSKQ